MKLFSMCRSTGLSWGVFWWLSSQATPGCPFSIFAYVQMKNTLWTGRVSPSARMFVLFNGSELYLEGWFLRTWELHSFTLFSKHFFRLITTATCFIVLGSWVRFLASALLFCLSSYFSLVRMLCNVVRIKSILESNFCRPDHVLVLSVTNKNA